MTKWFVAFGCVVVCLMPGSVASETPPTVAGAWEVTTRLPDRVLNERWVIQQRGATITGTAKGVRGDLPVSGSIAGASFRVTVRDADKTYRVRATVDGASMDGSVMYPMGEEYVWRAKRMQTR